MLAVLVFLFGVSSHASPFPATGSSILTDPEKGQFFRGFGFTLQAPSGNWVPTLAPGETVFETLRFEPRVPDAKSQARLSIRMDQLSESTPLENYARKWMRDYPSYGFEVLGTKNISLGGGRALLVDLIQKNKNRQLRQVILQKDQKVAVVTCLDRRDQFQGTLQACNQLLKTFQWREKPKEP